MAHFTKPKVIGNRDSVFIYIIGSNLQIKGGGGITAYHLNKTIAVIMRHWEWLARNVKKYNSLHVWELRHFPYRFGQRVYRSIQQNRSRGFFEDNVLFIEQIVEYDLTMRKLDVEKRKTGEEHETIFFFPRKDSAQIDALRKAVKIPDLDYSLINELAVIYASATTTILEPLSTCPTEFDCIAALYAQLNIWLSEIEVVETLTDPFRFGKNFKGNEIAQSLVYAFKCGDQINTKILWYENANGTAHSFYGNLRKRGYRGKDIEAIINFVGSSSSSKRIRRFHELAIVMSVVTGYIVELLSEASYKVNLDEGQWAWYNKNINKLSEIGIAKEQRDGYSSQLMDMDWTNKDWDIKSEIATRVQRVIKLTRQYLSDNGYMSHSDGSAKYRPDKLIPNNRRLEPNEIT